MDLALYVTNTDDLDHLDEALQNAGLWDIPKFIFATMFGDDPCAQEYVGNLVAAEWLENFRRVGNEPSRLYFGQEFCEYLIPSTADLDRALSFAAEAGLAFTYVTGYVTDAGLKATRANLEWLSDHAGDAEVVVNDWGVLSTIAKEFDGLKPVLGRLMIKQQRMARFTTQAPPVNMRGIKASQAAVNTNQHATLRRLNLSIPQYRNRLAQLGVERFDLDIAPQGVEIPADKWGFGVGCYYPWGYVTGSRNCPTAGMLDPERSFVVKGSPCSAPCRTMNRGAKVLQFPQPPVQRGNSVFIYHAHYAMQYWNGEVPTDRIVFEPWIPW